MTVLYLWPESALVGRNIPKERLYAESAASASLRQRFVNEVQRVRWAYKLGEESIRLRGNDTVPEIQIFEIDLKGEDVSDTVLAAVDRAVPSPIYYELHRTLRNNREVQPVAARKLLRSRGAKLSDYFRGEWVSEDVPREPLPPAIDLENLHARLLTALLPIQPRPGEGVSAVIGRTAGIRKLEREIAILDRRIRVERQFKRQVELRRELRARQGDLHSLMNQAEDAPIAEDATWRN